MAAGQNFHDLLGLKPAEREAALREIPVTPGRRSFRVAGIPVVVVHPGGSTSSYLVTTHSIWWRGLGVIHGGYLHPWSECRLLLRTLSGQPRRIGARVVACRLLRDHIHEVELEFETPIDVGLICSAPEALEETAGEAVQSEAFPESEARVLLIGESEVSRAIIAEMLGVVRIGVFTAASVASAIEAIERRSFEIVVADLDHCAGSGASVVRRLRKTGLSAPIVGITSDASAKTLRELRKAGLTAAVTAPVDPEKLLSTVTGYLDQPERKSATLSRRPDPDDRSGPRPVYGPPRAPGV